MLLILFPSGINLDALREGKINPQEMMKMSKKGKPIMLFIGVRGVPDRERTEQVSNLWAQSLQNAHLQVIGVRSSHCSVVSLYYSSFILQFLTARNFSLYLITGNFRGTKYSWLSSI